MAVHLQAGYVGQCNRVWRGGVRCEPQAGAAQNPEEGLKLTQPPPPTSAQACAAILARLPGSLLYSALYGGSMRVTCGEALSA